MIAVYRTKICPKCAQLKQFLDSLKIDYLSRDMATAEAITELRISGVYTLSAPVLEVCGVFYTTADLFEGDELKKEWIRGLMA